MAVTSQLRGKFQHLVPSTEVDERLRGRTPISLSWNAAEGGREREKGRGRMGERQEKKRGREREGGRERKGERKRESGKCAAAVFALGVCWARPYSRPSLLCAGAAGL